MAMVKAAGAARAPRGAAPILWARRLRALHLYVGALFAPAILFFAFSGALQELSLHEAQPGSNHAPPVWIQRLAAVHKHQTLSLPGKAAASPKTSKPLVKPQTVAMRLFFVATGIGLIASTLVGLYLAFSFARRPGLVAVLLLLGTAAPLAFLMT